MGTEESTKQIQKRAFENAKIKISRKVLAIKMTVNCANVSGNQRDALRKHIFEELV